jgi:hypothetical protein
MVILNWALKERWKDKDIIDCGGRGGGDFYKISNY